MTADLDRKLAEIQTVFRGHGDGRSLLAMSLLRLVAQRERQLRIVLFDHRRLSYDSQPDKIMSMFDAAALAALEGE